VSLLKVDHLTTAFKRGGVWTPVVDDLSFSIGAAETLAIVGESGSGKSVTAMSILRLLPENKARISGSVRLGDKELLGLGEAAMSAVRGRDIAMIFQEPMTSLNPVLPIGRQIGEAIIRHEGVTRETAFNRTVELLDRVRIPAARSRVGDYPHQMSGGMLQRVMIAMALACRPKLLIADEPTTALDVTVQAEILALLAQLQREDHMALLFITHDMGVVSEIADRTLVMFRSRAVECAPTAELFANPRQTYTRALLAAVPQLGGMAGKTNPATFPIIDLATGATAPEREMTRAPKTAAVPLLDVRDLSVRFDVKSGVFGRVTRRVHAVENVSFDLRRGETLAIVGESGCGKSTTGRAILRLTKPTSGTIRIDGQDVAALDRGGLRRARRAMQMIFQDPFSSLNPRLTVGAALAEPILAHGLAGKAEARVRAADLLARVGLEPAHAARYPHEFSGGQRQRIAIARALTLNPGLIVADEGVSALDVSIKAQVVNLLMQLQETLDLGLLFISHDMAVVERVAHRVAVMYLGEIVEIGPRASVFGDPRHPYTRRLLDAVPAVDPARRHAPRAVPPRDLPSPVRTLDYVAPARTYREVSPGHLVQVIESGPPS
jgi:peptide/nickel transport system ATP-binding protein